MLIDSRTDAVIEQIKASRLRGRGGAGFLTGNKWDFLAKAKADTKYIICNADEGDPGAYMNRNEIEGDPHSLLEGMIIGAYVMGATEGIVYVRAEYPLAVRRLNRAIEQAREYGLLGANILDRGFNFNIELVQGAGAFVCGEETALIASLEGFAGRPRPRPPYPAQKGLWGRPTNINNVETWYNIAPIVTRGPAWFAETGSAKSPGTKVFSLVGKVQNTGLIEMPLGTPLQSFIYDIGEGACHGRRVKAVQTGGPSGGCIPVEMFDTPGRLRKPRADSAPSWAPAAWWSWTKTTAWSMWPATSSNSRTPSPAENASRAASASTRPCAFSTPSPPAAGTPEHLESSRRAGPHDSRLLALRARPVRAQSRAHHHPPLPRRV